MIINELYAEHSRQMKYSSGTGACSVCGMTFFLLLLTNPCNCTFHLACTCLTETNIIICCSLQFFFVGLK